MNRTILINPGFIAQNQKNLPKWYQRYITPFITWDRDKYDENIISILESSMGMLADTMASIPYVENLINEVEEVIDGKREKTGWWYGDGDGTVDVYKEKTKLVDAFSPNEGELPTIEIYELLKDWLEFLNEYYKRSFVPLEWIKEEYMEEAKNLQKPING